MAFYFAQLNEAWFREQAVGLEAALVSRGWTPLHWCVPEDLASGSWMDNGLDTNHPERASALVFLQRLLAQLPSPGPVLIVGDSTLSNWLREDWPGGRIWYDWRERERFLRDAGAPPGSAFWSIPGDRCSGIAEQLRNAYAWADTSYESVLMVGGWNDKWWADSTELAALVTEAATR